MAQDSAAQSASSLKELADLFVRGNGTLFGGRPQPGLGGGSGNPANTRTAEARGAAAGRSGTGAGGITESKRLKLQRRQLKSEALKAAATNAHVKELHKEIKSQKARAKEAHRLAMLTRDKIRQAKEIIKNTRDVNALTGAQKRQLDELGVKYAEAFKAEDELIDAGREVRKQLISRAQQLRDEIKEAERAANATPPGGGGGGGGGGGPGVVSNTIQQLLPKIGLAQGIRQGTGLGLDTLRSEMRTGVGLTGPEMISAAAYGMDPKQYMEILAEFRTTANGMRMTTEEMGNSMKKASLSLLTVTGDFEEGMRIQADIMQTYKNLGGDPADSEEFLKYQNLQIASFKQLHEATNMTSMQFRELQTDLLAGQDVRATMFRMDKKERAAYGANLVQQYSRLKLYDLENEAAKKMIDAMSAMGAKGPKERLKEAAKAQALMGAMGMGAEAEEYGKLVMKGNKRSADEQAKFIEITNKLTDTTSEAMGSGFVGELATSALLEKTGMDQYFGPKGSFSEFAFREEQQIEEQVELLKGSNERLSKLNATAEKALQVAMQTAAASGTGLGQLAAGAAGVAAGAALTGRRGGAGGGGDGDGPDGNNRRRRRLGRGKLGLLLGAGALLAPDAAAAASDAMGGLSGGAGRLMDGVTGAFSSTAGTAAGVASLIPGPQQIPLKAFALGSMAEGAYSSAFPDASAKSSHMIGTGIDTVLSVFSDEAKQRLETMKMYEEQQQKDSAKMTALLEEHKSIAMKMSESMAKTAEETKGLRTDTQMSTEATVEATQETTEAVKKTTQNFSDPNKWRSQRSGM